MSVALLERHDGFAALRNGLRRLAAEREEWAGIPMPLEDAPLVVEPSYPNAQALMAFGEKPEPETADKRDVRFRNSFWSTWRRTRITIGTVDGKVRWAYEHPANHLTLQLLTLGCSYAWGIEQEANAVQLLATLVKHHTFKQYMLTGSFLERSERSGLTYMFRRLRPTVVITSRGENGEPSNELRIVCTLCLHPIAYYSGSWAGAMCPTDDVIAHLQLMRGDEPMLWRRANQHPADRPESGI